MHKKNALGADANPLARLITEAKVTFIDENTLMELLSNIIKDAKEIDSPIISSVGNIDLWFSKSTQRQLAQLIVDTNESEYQLYFSYYATLPLYG